MTTNVYDASGGVLATDSRWSYQHGWFLIYIDETAFEKLEVIGNFAFMFAGRGQVIQNWKTYLRSKPTDGSNMPDCDGMCMSGVNTTTGAIRFAEGNSVSREGATFAGSGSKHAVECWLRNRNAKRSVESAKVFDPATGGRTMYYELNGGGHNLAQGHVGLPGTIADVDKALLTRGIIMDTRPLQAPGVPFPLSNGASTPAPASDVDKKEIDELMRKLQTGEASAEAPCDGMYSEWTPEAKDRLKGFLGEVFDWK